MSASPKSRRATNKETEEIRKKKWLMFYAYPAHISGNLWSQTRRALGKRSKQITNPKPHEEVEHLFQLFCSRVAQDCLHLHTQSTINRLSTDRFQSFECSDVFPRFKNTQSASKGTASGTDDIMNSVLSNAGQMGNQMILRLSMHCGG